MTDSGAHEASRSPFRNLVVLCVALAPLLRAQEVPRPREGLGEVSFPVSCAPAAQGRFDRAIALLHHMTYPQARAAFDEIASADTSCAMAHWGVAMTLFQPLWPTRPGPAERRAGWSAVQTAKALGTPTERERLLVAAAEAFFHEPDSADYWLRIRRWEEAMARAFDAIPTDPEITAFYALAHLATAPASTTDATHSERAAALLATVLVRNPGHPGAMHYLVHANDAIGRERESLDITRRYEDVAPANPHALHMPTHIYVRLGEWDAVVRGNARAALAALEHPAGPTGEWVWDEFPHAVEYLVYAELQRGADSAAVVQLARLRATMRLEPSFKTAFHAASIPARIALERRAWAEAAALVPRVPADLAWDRFTWPEAITWFARGLGAARLGDRGAAQAALARIEALEAATARTGEQVFTANIAVLRLGLDAWIAHGEGRRDSALVLMREAARVEEATPKHAVTPAPTLPARELEGDLLLEQGRPVAALAAYRRSLESRPGRFNSLLGAARAARAGGDASAAAGYYRTLLDIAGRGTRDGVAEARQALGRP